MSTSPFNSPTSSSTSHHKKKRKIPDTPHIIPPSHPQSKFRRLASPLSTLDDEDLFANHHRQNTDNTKQRMVPQPSAVLDEYSSEGSDSDDSVECRLNKKQSHRDQQQGSSKPDQRQVDEELKKEQHYVEEIESKNRSQNRELCDLFYDLQAISNQHKIRISYPELVIIGGQSDGKSSLSEALCGFQFNLVDSNIGTRRPVIIQMRNDPSQLTPKCTFLKEDGYKSEQEVPVEKIADEIRKRTQDYCGDISIRSRPIVIRISFKNASNLTVYDLPGFRNNPDDPHGEYIKQLAYKICKPKNRILICLEQSTVEYANSQSRPLVQEFDSQLTRTIFVQTKFDNRRKQFTTKAEADKYLRAEDASEAFHQKQVPIFFISLPAGVDGRNLAAEEFNRALKEVHLKDVKNLLKLNVDPAHKDKIGFFRLRNFLENRLTLEYRKSVDPISRKIVSLIDKKQKQANHLSETIQNLDKQDFRDVLDDIISDFHRKINTAISGTTMFDPQLCGMTLEEEKQKSGSTDWPNFVLEEYPIRNSSFKLYGGSQVERLLSEFAVIAHSQEFPATSSDEVVASLGLSCASPSNVYRAISDLAQKKCVKTFAPLIHVLFHRSRFILKHLIRVVVHYLEDERQHRTDRLMLAHVRKSADTFIDDIVRQVEDDTLKDFETTTQNVDWNMIMSAKPSEQDMEYDLLNPSPEDTLKRVQGIVTREQDPNLKLELFSGDLTDERCRELKLVAARLFAGLRFNFVKNTQSRYRNFFLQPLLRRMDSHLRKEFKMSNEELKEMIGIRIVEFKEKHEELQGQLRGLLQQRERFQRACDSISNIGNGMMDHTDCNSEDSQ